MEENYEGKELFFPQPFQKEKVTGILSFPQALHSARLI